MAWLLLGGEYQRLVKFSPILMGRLPGHGSHRERLRQHVG